jgi:hypothetical protein
MAMSLLGQLLIQTRQALNIKERSTAVQNWAF